VRTWLDEIEHRLSKLFSVMVPIIGSCLRAIGRLGPSPSGIEGFSTLLFFVVFVRAVKFVILR
jgi:hypothetical protein